MMSFTFLLIISYVLTVVYIEVDGAFVIPKINHNNRHCIPRLNQNIDDRNNNRDDESNKRQNLPKQQQPNINKQKGQKKEWVQESMTLVEIQQEMLAKPAQYISKSIKPKKGTKASKSRRTRKRVENPKQQYVYAALKQYQTSSSAPPFIDKEDDTRSYNNDNEKNRNGKIISMENKRDSKNGPGNTLLPTTDPKITTSTSSSSASISSSSAMIAEAKLFGLLPSFQNCDPILSSSSSMLGVDQLEKKSNNNYYQQPRIVGKIRVSENELDNTSSSHAYVIEKPMAWSILGNLNNDNQKKNKNKSKLLDSMIESLSNEESNIIEDIETITSIKSSNQKQKTSKKQVKIVNDDGTIDFIEYDEMDVLALLTPEELEEENEKPNVNNNKSIRNENNNGISTLSSNVHNGPIVQPIRDPNTNPITAANIQRIEARQNDDTTIDEAIFATTIKRRNKNNDDDDDDNNNIDPGRPSIISWLKNKILVDEGRFIRGGNFWKPVIGATDIDDSGLLVLCPKVNVPNLICHNAEYIAVVGTGGYMSSSITKLETKIIHKSSPSKIGMQKTKPDTQKHQQQQKQQTTTRGDVKEVVEEDNPVDIELISKLIKGRFDDPVRTVKVMISDELSRCNHVIDPCQNEYMDGIRGDPYTNPFDRRSQRRLIHCHSTLIGSAYSDDQIQYTLDELPDDISIYAERNNTKNDNKNFKKHFMKGSYIGRAQLRDNTLTNSFREINGAADGYPGWYVDRYDKWLLIQHDPSMPRGPTPSIHDGNTAGVYYLELYTDRSAAGSNNTMRPQLIEGKAAPDLFPIKENGITYLVSLHKDLSTGIFLDQRLSRAWLISNCCSETKLLNCFAHTGAYSVAAASAGASTVSIDLSQKWLQRLPDQLQYNNILYNEKHDCIYGDCFDWLTRLKKRGEKYDIVILDPPSTSSSSSVGRRKNKRFSILTDMDELVALASSLVKRNGLLWTTTNSASISTIKFAKLCKKGFELNDGMKNNVKLERIQPMSNDFPSVGSQPVKNLIWRIM